MTATPWRKRKAKVKAKVKARRKQMIADLGGKCKRCGSKKKLEFHHTHPRTWETRKHNQWVRLNKYQEDIDAGHIEVWCKPCNQEAGIPDDPDDAPF